MGNNSVNNNSENITPVELTPTQVYKTLTCVGIDKSGKDGRVYHLKNGYGLDVSIGRYGLLTMVKCGYTFTNLKVKSDQIVSLIKADKIQYKINDTKYNKSLKKDSTAVNLGTLLLDLESLFLENKMPSFLGKGYNVTLTDAGTGDVKDLEQRIRLLTGSSIISTIEFPKYNALVKLDTTNTEIFIYFCKAIRFIGRDTFECEIADRAESSKVSEKQSYLGNNDQKRRNTYFDNKIVTELVIDNVDIVEDEAIKSLFNEYTDTYDVIADKFTVSNIVLHCTKLSSFVGRIANKIELTGIQLLNCDTATSIITDKFENGHIDSLVIKDIYAPKLKNISKLINGTKVDNLEISDLHMPNLTEISDLICNTKITDIVYDGSIKGEKLETVKRLIDTAVIGKVVQDYYSKSTSIESEQQRKLELNFDFLNTSYGNLKSAVQIINNSVINYGINMENLDLNKLSLCNKPLNAVILGDIKLGTSDNDIVVSVNDTDSTGDNKKQVQSEEQRVEQSGIQNEISITVRGKADIATQLKKEKKAQQKELDTKNQNLINSLDLKDVFKYVKKNTEDYRVELTNSIIYRYYITGAKNCDYVAEPLEKILLKIFSTYKDCKEFFSRDCKDTEVIDLIQKVFFNNLETYSILRNSIYNRFQDDIDDIKGILRIKTGWTLNFTRVDKDSLEQTVQEQAGQEKQAIFKLKQNIWALCNSTEKKVTIAYVDHIEFRDEVFKNFNLPDGTFWFETVDVSELYNNSIIMNEKLLKDYVIKPSFVSSHILSLGTNFMWLVSSTNQTKVCNMIINQRRNKEYNIKCELDKFDNSYDITESIGDIVVNSKGDLDGPKEREIDNDGSYIAIGKRTHSEIRVIDNIITDSPFFSDRVFYFNKIREKYLDYHTPRTNMEKYLKYTLGYDLNRVPSRIDISYLDLKKYAATYKEYETSYTIKTYSGLGLVEDNGKNLKEVAGEEIDIEGLREAIKDSNEE